MRWAPLVVLAFLSASCAAPPDAASRAVKPATSAAISGDASAFGFSPEATGLENVRALQAAVDRGGTICVRRPGTYKIAGTVYLGSHTSLSLASGVFLQKSAELGPFSQVILNKGALTKTYDEDIAVEGLNLLVNGVDAIDGKILGLRGQVAFFYVRDLRISRLRCLDLGAKQFCVQVCTFEDATLDDLIIKGNKDGVHLGRGKRFTLSNAVFQTFDDAIALNGHDYDTGNPELGWIEEGLVQNCRDLDAPRTTGYFCRILAGGWTDWQPGMTVRKSDTVVSGGRLYRVQADPDGKTFTSRTRPEHARGSRVLDGIRWAMVQDDATRTAGVRNVTFRDIFLEKPRTAFSIHFDNDRYSRSYYPGAPVPLQEHLTFDDIRVLYDAPRDLLSIGTPVDAINIRNSYLRNNRIEFHATGGLSTYGRTSVGLLGCTFSASGKRELLRNGCRDKEIRLETANSTWLSDDFAPTVQPGPGRVTVRSDLPGLK